MTHPESTNRILSYCNVIADLCLGSGNPLAETYEKWSQLGTRVAGSMHGDGIMERLHAPLSGHLDQKSGSGRPAGQTKPPRSCPCPCMPLSDHLGPARRGRCHAMPPLASEFLKDHQVVGNLELLEIINEPACTYFYHPTSKLRIIDFPLAYARWFGVSLLAYSSALV